MAHILEKIEKNKEIIYTDGEIIAEACTNLISQMWVFQKVVEEHSGASVAIVDGWRNELVRIRRAIETKLNV